ncbi:MAG: 5'-nucleotidase C-terminal domain-containing protein, partial [Spirochaetales bacterium]|nr:5'-nucleotidase C-terminal domain-containing protein [Spirochaetales bacterium]
EVLAAAKQIIAEVDADYGVKFAESKVDLNGEKAPGNRNMETNNGDLITDSMLWAIVSNPSALEVPEENVVAITNGGGIRAWIRKGDVSMKDVNTVLPFGNTVAVVYVSGAELLEALEASTYCTPAAVGGFPQVAGMKYTIDTTKEYAPNAESYPESTYYGPSEIRRVTINEINGKPFDPEATYAVVTNNFCAVGGDTYYAFAAATSQFDTGLPLDEVLMDYITKVLNGVIGEQYAEPQGRITVIQ